MNDILELLTSRIEELERRVQALESSRGPQIFWDYGYPCILSVCPKCGKTLNIGESHICPGPQVSY